MLKKKTQTLHSSLLHPTGPAPPCIGCLLAALHHAGCTAPQRQGASPSTTPGTCRDAVAGKGQADTQAPGDVCRGKEAASRPSTRGRERKPQTENSLQTPRKGEGTGGPCELSGSSWDASRAPGVCKLTSRRSNTACERRCTVEGSPAPLRGCAHSFRSRRLISTAKLPPDSSSKTRPCAKAPLSSHSPPLRGKENGEPRSTAAKRQVWEERQKAPAIYFYICCCQDQSEQQGRHGKQNTKRCCISRLPQKHVLSLILRQHPIRESQLVLSKGKKSPWHGNKSVGAVC